MYDICAYIYIPNNKEQKKKKRDIGIWEEMNCKSKKKKKKWKRGIKKVEGREGDVFK